MRRFLTPILYVILAGIGYALGSQRPWASSGGHRDRVNSHEAPSREAIARSRSTHTELPFSESRDRLTELSKPTGQDRNASHLLDGKRLGQDELEIERIVASATKDDLLAFFSTEDLDKINAATLDIAYARLVTFSLDEALAIWTDHFRRTSSGIGANGLVRTWAKMDATAAERWIDGLSDASVRTEALFALLDEVVETSPDLVARRLTEIGGRDPALDYQTNHLVSQVALRLAPQALAPLAERFLSEMKKGWENQNHLVTLLEEWGKSDGAAMLAWVIAQPPGRFRDHVIPRVVEARSKADPAAFLQELAPSLAGNEALGEMAGQAWLKWLAKDQDEAMNWFQTHGGHLKMSPQSVGNTANWTSEQADLALSRISGMPDGEFKSQSARAMLFRLSQTDPKSALAYGQELLPPGPHTDHILTISLENLARGGPTTSGDPAGALDWALENLSDGQGKKDAVRSIMTEWSNSSPLLALERVKALPESLRKGAYDGIAYRWAERAPEQLMDYLSKSTGPATPSTLAERAFRSFGTSRGADAYLARALALPNEAIRTQAIEGLFSGWSIANLESSALALDTLERGPLRDTAVAAFVTTASWSDREAAVTWSLDITDPKKRREVTMQQSRYWLNADREAATQWIKESGNLPDEWRAELLQSKP